jgi:hypothetical protein
VSFGLVYFTVCTSNVLVGGENRAVVWLVVVCCIDNCYNFFVNCSTGFVSDEPTIAWTCGPTLCLVLSSIENGTSGKISYNKSN